MQFSTAGTMVRHGIWGCLILVAASCSKNPQAPTRLKNDLDLSNTSQAAVHTHAHGVNLRPQFEQLANLLAQRAPRIIEKIRATDKVEATFAELNLDSDLPRQFFAKDGRILETTLERAQPCRVIPEALTSEIIFAPDPDRFQSDGQDYICTGWQASDGGIKPVTFTLDEYVAHLSGIPLYLVGYKDHVPSAPKKAAGVAADGYYACCHQIHMKKDQDPWSNEECQVFTTPPGGSEYNYTTGLIFDGISRYDAAYRYVYFPDVNSTSSIYLCSQYPAFFRLEVQKQGWVAIEDDDTPGVHNRNFHLSGPLPPQPQYVVMSAAVDVQRADGSAIWGTSRYFKYWWCCEGINSDDIVQSGCYEEFDQNWNVMPDMDVHYALNHDEFWMQRKFF